MTPYTPQTTFANGLNPMESRISIQNLAHWISTTGPKTVKDVISQFQSNENTVRRRLQALEDSGEIKRSVGNIGGRRGVSFWVATAANAVIENAK